MKSIRTIIVSGSANVKIEDRKITALGGVFEVNYKDNVLEITSPLCIVTKPHISGNVISLGSVNGHLSIGDDITINGMSLDEVISISSKEETGLKEFDLTEYTFDMVNIIVEDSANFELNYSAYGVSIIKLSESASLTINKLISSDNLKILTSQKSRCVIQESDVAWLTILSSENSCVYMTGTSGEVDIISSDISLVDCRSLKTSKKRTFNKDNSVIRI